MGDIQFNLDGLNSIASRLQQAKNTSIVVGILGNAGSEIVQRAVFTEFGTKKMPAWRWLYKSLNRIKPDYQRMAGAVYNDILNNRAPNYNLIGTYAVGKVKETIGLITTPRLSPITIAQKGSSKPLIDTGQMRNSVSFEIRRTNE